MITLLLLALSSAAWADDSTGAVLKKILPPKVATLLEKRPAKDDAITLLGKPDLVEGDAVYYVMDGFKYALSVTFKKDKLVQFRYRFTNREYRLSDFALNLADAKDPATTNHEKGRHLSFVDKKHQLRLTFVNNEKKTLDSLELDTRLGP